MKQFPVPKNEQARLQLLHDLELLDSAPEPIFDHIVALVRKVFAADAAFISLIDERRQWFKANVGLPFDETPREHAFCSHVVSSGATLVVTDALCDPRFQNNPYVDCKGGIRGYAGAAVTLNEDHHIGTLCVVTQTPRTFTEAEIQQLETLARWVALTIEEHYELANYRAERDLLAQGPMCMVVWRVEPSVGLSYVAENAQRVLGYPSEYLLREDIRYESIVHPEDRGELLTRMQRLIDGHEDALEMDYRVIQPTADGQQIKWVHHFARVDRGAQQEVLRIRGYLTDDSKGKALELELQETNQNFELALTAGELFTWSWLIPTNRLMVSDSWRRRMGYHDRPPGSFDWFTCVHPADQKLLRVAIEQHLKGQTPRFEVRFRMRHHDGHYLWLHSVGRLVEEDTEFGPAKMTGIHHDITSEVEKANYLKQQSSLLKLISYVQHEFMLAKDFRDVCDHALPELMKVTASGVGLVGELAEASVSPTQLKVHGLQLEDDAEHTHTGLEESAASIQVMISGAVAEAALQQGEPQLCHAEVSALDMRLSPELLPRLRNALLLPLHFKQEVVGVLLLGNRDEPYQPHHIELLRPILDTLGTLLHVRRMEEERLVALERLRKMATTDELTGVANRRVFWEAVTSRYDEFMRYNVPMSVAIIDLDHFKQINDTYGHAAGDKVLRQFCEIVKTQLRDLDLLGRLGGEEFAILLPYTVEAEATKALERIRKHLSETPIVLPEQALQITFSAGITQLSPQDTLLDHWLARADEALYRAKALGRNQCVTAPAAD
ncbi:hypothetical protein CWI80_05290 [Pseudidiomarina sediminum]|uniref:diguanylate cyclase n=1 Tax=Pseudidiomarina sediminum TaxID=431675 RepID=A0A432ZBK1_9GAMM|nr:diguanylate cyclase [Pseudidiomarina sediminum]RUO74752.1 hypothetical protein CWI80_05290 [Pseudidiomarina sediminum]